MKRLTARCSKSRDDWLQAKKAFVNAFVHYPLYTYFVPDQKTRKEFLNRYMQANYEMTVANGRGILVCIEMHNEDEMKTDEELSQIPVKKSKIIGSVLFVYPSEDGVGWANKDKDAYTAGYQRMGVTDMLADGIMEKIEAYEEWEYEEVVKKLDKAKRPLWNGLYCSLDANYYGQGFGSSVGADVIDVLCQHHIARQIYANKFETSEESGQTNHVEMQPGTLSDFTPCSECFNAGRRIQNKNSGQLSAFLDYYYRVCKLDLSKRRVAVLTSTANKKGKKIITESYSTSIFARLIHRFGLLNHHAIVIPVELRMPTICGGESVFDEDSADDATNEPTPTTIENVKEDPLKYTRNQEKNHILENAPLIGAITHCARSANFYKRIGFDQIFHKPYVDAESCTVPFEGHLLIGDPFKAGKLDDFAALFEDNMA